MDGVMPALAMKKTRWKQDFFFAIKLAGQKLFKYYAEVTQTTGMLFLCAQILDPFLKLQSFRKWDKGIDINPEDETSYSMQYKQTILTYVEIEYCAKHRRVLVHESENKLSSNLVPSEMSSGSSQSSFDPYDFSSDHEEYLMPTYVAGMTPGQSDCTALLLSTARLHLNLLPEVPLNLGQNHPNLNDYHSDPMEICCAFWILHITDWWHEQEETHSKYANLSNVARDIFSIIPHGVGVESCFSLGRDVISWRQSKTTAETLGKKVIVRQFTWANTGILAADDPAFYMTNTENKSENNKEVEERELYRIAKVYDCLEMWQGSQNLPATQKESRAQNKQMKAVRYILDMEEIVKVSWSLF